MLTPVTTAVLPLTTNARAEPNSHDSSGEPPRRLASSRPAIDRGRAHHGRPRRVGLGRARAPAAGAADLWIVSDPLTPADVAVVLGGGTRYSALRGGRTVSQGLVKKVLVSQVADGRAVAIGAELGHTEVNRQVLLKLGVPADAIETFGSSNKNTKEEALALLEWTQRHASRAVIIPAGIFEARRVRWTFHHEFAGQPVRIEIVVI